MLSIGNVIESGFRLIREHPLAVLVWGVICALAQIGSILLMRPIFAMQSAAIQGGSAPDPGALLSAMLPFYGYQSLLMLLMIVLSTAAFRAIMRPEDSMAAYLRLGMDELRVIGLSLLVGILFYVAMLVFSIAVVAIGAGLFVSDNRGAGIAIGVVLGLAGLCLGIWVMVRLSLAGPLTVYRREFSLGAGWRLSKGHFWTLFTGYLVIGVLLTVLWMIVSTLTMGSYMLDVMRSAAQPGAVRALAQAQAEQWDGFSPKLILMFLGGGITGALWIALGAGAAAGAARQLIGDDQEDIGEVFA